MLKLLAAAFAVLFAVPALAWTVEDMNKTINSANFIVANGCSGTLISKKHRLILTNHHCIGSGVSVRTKEITDMDGIVKKIKVEELRDLSVAQRLYDGHRLVGNTSFKAKIVARWKESDLALLQSRAQLPNEIAVKIFAGDSVSRGEPVFVVGNPLGLDATVTKGVISSTTRMFRVGWADAEVPFLQVDAGITGGNSGGSLFNDSGELIGVPAAGVPGNGHLGLAIPFFKVQEFLTEHCFGEVWDNEAEKHEECIKAKKEPDLEESE